MNVILSGGPKGGDTTDWPNDPKDGDTLAFECPEGTAEYRLDFEFGQATFVGMTAVPKPSTFVSKVAV